jgi:dedicator of cytokinesis protein 6/7/8
VDNCPFRQKEICLIKKYFDFVLLSSQLSTKSDLVVMDSAMLPNKSRKLLHEELILQWVVSSGVAKELAIANSWFFFELMIKSMVTHLASMELLEMPRRIRFNEQFLDDVTSLVAMVTSEIISRFGKDTKVNSRQFSSIKILTNYVTDNI